MTERQIKDREIASKIWYALRDFGNLDIDDVDGWKKCAEYIDAAAREHPRFRKVFTEIYGILADGARRCKSDT